MARDSKDLIVALDIGTSKVACLVAELRADGSLEILGMGGHQAGDLRGTDIQRDDQIFIFFWHSLSL